MKRSLQIALRVAGCLVLLAVTLEVCARTEDTVRYGAPFFGNYSMTSLVETDAVGKHGRPHSSYLKWHLNAEGYRGPELRDGEYRIACVGSSETFGLYESPEMEWPRQLESLLNAGQLGRPFEVVNTGFAGMSVGTSLKRLPEMLATVRPQMVVVYPSYTAYIRHAPPPPDKFEPRMVDRVRVLLKKAVPQPLVARVQTWQLRLSGSDAKAMDRLPEEAVEAFRSDLDAMVTQLQARGVRVVLVTHANRFGKTVLPAERSVMESWRKFYPALKEGGFLDMEQRMSDVMRAEGAARGVPVVDAAEEIAPGPKDFAEFVHFTDAGARAMALLVAAEVERERGGAEFPPPR
ncbi:MAG: SGNH/GDSL hydrolase family protein [Acidobacteriota bacterium]